MQSFSPGIIRVLLFLMIAGVSLFHDVAPSLALKNTPTAEEYLQMGYAHSEKGDYKEALEAFERVTELKPDSAGAWFGRGVMLVELKRYDEALKAFDRASDLTPAYDKAWIGIGISLTDLKRYDEALKAYDRAIKLTPDEAGAWYNRASIYALKGERERALKDLARAIELDSKVPAFARKDKSFDSLRDDPEFRNLMGDED